MASYLITGASRGIGFEIARQLAAKPATEVGTIFATSRSLNASLEELAEQHPGRVAHVPIDVTDPNSIRDAVQAVERTLDGKGLDVLINNAGVTAWCPIEAMQDLEDTFRINVNGPHIMIQAFLPLLRRGQMKRVINISTSVGSIAKQNVFGVLPTPAYKITKAALNMMTVIYAQELRHEGFTVYCISPGVSGHYPGGSSASEADAGQWLKSNEANAHADLPVETGVRCVLDSIRTSGTEANGRFLNIHVPGWERNPGLNQYDGLDLPW
ncbi:short chain oxidoreductase [Aspergillus heteromorphus CBS 117.55]|uniref:Short chain oxidoreductase n=1 Tax=Aspergillus heteromorphus CBS 117.55 TaxID=1448321 RepID=A0A317UYK1_9EURO|nr:short chain oxidoreductase [Aspergillus heteromorphus CBS 117.55]PWY66018.1 short chain oxidoreductase [Aspergillus heteromorphus CBS 117.55]